MFHCKLYSWCRFLVLSICKADKGPFQEHVFTVRLPNILSAVSIIWKCGKPIEFSVILTLPEDKLCS